MNNPRIPKKPGQPNKSDKHSDLYTDEDPKGTIHGLGFKDVATAKQSVSKIRNSGRSHAHKIQAAIAMEQRARVMGKTSEAAIFRKFINSMKKKTEEMNEEKKRNRCKPGNYYCYTDKKCKSIPIGYMIGRDGMLEKEDDSKGNGSNENGNGSSISEEGLRDWFGKSKSKDGKGGWVNVVTGGTCASDEPGEGTPKCVSSAKRASMTKAERLSAARRKKAADPGQQQKTGAAKPTYVKTDVKEGWSDKYKRSIDCDNPKGFSQKAHCQGRKKKMNEEADKKGKGSGKKDACYHKVKSRYSVWPSAYASGALVKCRKVGAANWGNKSEGYDHEYSMARSELSTIISAAKRIRNKMKGEGNIEAWVQSKITKAADYIDTAADYVASGEMDEACWSGYKQVGMKKKGKKIVPNCVPANEEAKIEEALRLPAQNGNLVSVIVSWRGKTYLNKMFFPQIKMPTRREVTNQIQKVYPGATVLSYQVSEFIPGETFIQTGLPQGGSAASVGSSRAYVKTYGEEVISEVAAWQRREGKNQSGGLNEKGRKSYERENPGSDLKAPSKKVGNPRRKSFCARMKGMKKKLTSAKTASDPDSRINKSLRAWNC